MSADAGRLAALTGLPLDPYFAAPKMTWLRENITRDGVVTTTDTWLLVRLGIGYMTYAATASRTMLLDLDDVVADGGLTRSRLLVQAQADLLQAPVEVSRSPHATALGAAALARLGLGEIADLAEAAGPAEVEWVAEPAITPEEAAKRLAGFDSAQRSLLARRGPALS